MFRRKSEGGLSELQGYLCLCKVRPPRPAPLGPEDAGGNPAPVPPRHPLDSRLPLSRAGAAAPDPGGIFCTLARYTGRSLLRKGLENIVAVPSCEVLFVPLEGTRAVARSAGA